MARILRAKSSTSPKTPNLLRVPERSRIAEIQGGIKRVTSRRSIRRLFVRDPASINTRPGSDQFKSPANTDPRIDFSKSPGSVSKLDSTPTPPVGRRGVGHGKTVPTKSATRVKRR